MLEIDAEVLTVTIPLDEYKELLMIKGKYEELKSQEMYRRTSPHIKGSGSPIPESPYTITSWYNNGKHSDNILKG